jgi:hypothetical protein
MRKKSAFEDNEALEGSDEINLHFPAGFPKNTIHHLLFLFLTSLAWRCEKFSPTNLRLPHHIPLITAPSLRWSLAMGLIYTKAIIYFSSLRQI